MTKRVNFRIQRGPWGDAVQTNVSYKAYTMAVQFFASSAPDPLSSSLALWSRPADHAWDSLGNLYQSIQDALQAEGRTRPFWLRPRTQQST